MTWVEEEKEEPVAAHASETRSLTLTYASGFFIFEILEPIKKYWAEGEQVKIHYRVKNTGNVASAGKIEVYDGTTLLCTWTISKLDAGYSFDMAEATDYKLKMPAKDWTLKFVLTP